MAVGWPRGEDGASRRCCILSSGVGFWGRRREYGFRGLIPAGFTVSHSSSGLAWGGFALWVERRTPLQLPRLIFPERKASGTSSRRPLRLWYAPRLPRARQAPGLLGAGSGPAAVGTPASPQVLGRAAARPASPLRRGALRWGGARRAAAPSARPDRGGASRQARSWASAGLCARLSGYTLSAPRAPRAGWPRTSADSSGVRRAGSGARSPPGGSLSLGSLDCCSPSPGSQRGELEADPAGRRAPINSTRVLAWRPPGCARTDKVVRRDSGRAAAAGEDPAAEPPCVLEPIPRLAALRAQDPAGCCLPADVREALRCGGFLTRPKWESLESWP